MEIHEITKTKEYAEAKGKIRDEQKEFFSRMNKDSPELYKVFAVSSKSIREKIYQNLTGREVIID